jgi:hypothetical protein
MQPGGVFEDIRRCGCPGYVALQCAYPLSKLNALSDMVY